MDALSIGNAEWRRWLASTSATASYRASGCRNWSLRCIAQATVRVDWVGIFVLTQRGHELVFLPNQGRKIDGFRPRADGVEGLLPRAPEQLGGTELGL